MIGGLITQQLFVSSHKLGKTYCPVPSVKNFVRRNNPLRPCRGGGICCNPGDSCFCSQKRSKNIQGAWYTPAGVLLPLNYCTQDIHTPNVPHLPRYFRQAYSAYLDGTRTTCTGPGCRVCQDKFADLTTFARCQNPIFQIWF